MLLQAMLTARAAGGARWYPLLVNCMHAATSGVVCRSQLVGVDVVLQLQQMLPYVQQAAAAAAQMRRSVSLHTSKSSMMLKSWQAAAAN
jgi:hypothetical protein